MGSERIRVGTLDELPANRCRGVADGRVVVARLGDTVVAFQARCLHQDSQLTGGVVQDGVLTCPQHFWRYDLHTGEKVGEPHQRLQSFPVEIVEGEVFVELPPLPATLPMREFLRGFARGEIVPEDHE